MEPEPSPWQFPPASSFDPHDDLVAMGADLSPGSLLAAYRHGLFPMPIGAPGTPMHWFSPVRRGVLPLEGFTASRSLRRARRDFTIRIDTAFEAVLDACADPTREHGWIDADIKQAYLRLHRMGWAHSVEAWQDDQLVGGLYGLAIGGLFAGESMFHRVTNASKVALVALVELLSDEHVGNRLLDVQWSTEHLASVGVVEVARPDYLTRLAGALECPVPAAFQVPGRA